MKESGSVTTFKKIIGRCSRLDPTTGKTFFRVIDYTNATRLFDDWDLPTVPAVAGATTGTHSLSGIVQDEESGELIPGASVSIRVVSRLLAERSEEHTSELQSLMRISYAVFCLKKK